MKMQTKKKVIGLLLAGTMVVAGAGVAMADDTAAPQTAAGVFVDANGDGICDNRGQRLCFADADGDGVCDHRGQRPGFVDADGDGVCDNQGQRQGHGCGRGAMRGSHGGGHGRL